MSHWVDRATAPSNIRLYVPGRGWRQYSDSLQSEDTTEERTQPQIGAGEEIASALLNFLNATNLVVLTGTGSSFAAINSPDRPTPAGMAQVWDAVREATGHRAFDGIVGMFGETRVDGNIEKLLSLCRMYLELYDGDSHDEGYRRIAEFAPKAERAILARVNFVDRYTNLDAHAALIQKIGRRGARKPRAKLFTTNYDLCFEEVARRTRFTLIDGFSHGLEQTYDRLNFGLDIVRRDGGREGLEYIQNVLQFYKLHGSIDWRRVGGEILRTREETGRPVLIYPRSSKYQESFDAPYLDMLSSFQAALREPDTALLVSGFGFNDDHISGPIMSAVESNMSLRLVVCDPAFVSGEALERGGYELDKLPVPKNRFLASFMSLADTGDARIHLMNGRFQDLAVTLPDLIGETDRERHVQRMRALRDTKGGQNT
ncbi:SIR2 family protein [Mesorhizobium sp. UC22_110]|uniref:SIR2 family protein n=1 Tax=unclassified Mesorhizobium TaxID=325217 RepID=UPI00366EF625